VCLSSNNPVISACLNYAECLYFPRRKHSILLLESAELESKLFSINAPAYILHRIAMYLALKIGHASTFGNNGAYINWREDHKCQYKKKQINIHFSFLYKDIEKLAGRHTKKIMKWINLAFPVAIRYKKNSHTYLRIFNPYGYFKNTKKKDFTNSYFWSGLISAVAQTETKRGFKMLMSKWGIHIARKIVKERGMVLKIFKRMLSNSWAKYSADRFLIDFVRRLLKDADKSICLQKVKNQVPKKKQELKLLV